MKKMNSSEISIPPRLLTVKQYEGAGYSPIIDYNSWRVAILNYIDELKPINLTSMDKHNETDEVFVLLKGEVLLFIGENLKNSLGQIYGITLEPYKVYIVRRGVWHTHTLSKDASVLIIENQDTSNENSTRFLLTNNQKQRIIGLANSLFSGHVNQSMID